MGIKNRYGQTGSGKTYTMKGTMGNPGIIPNAMAEIFEKKKNKKLHFTYVEIQSKNNVIDLLKNEDRICEIDENSNYKPTLKVKTIKNKDTIVEVNKKLYSTLVVLNICKSILI